MSFLSRLFGSADPLESIRKASRQGRHAEVVARCAELDLDTLDAVVRAELLDCRNTAAASLAQINFAEGVACQQGGETSRAIEHFELAAQLATDAAMRRSAEERLAELGAKVAVPAVAAAASCASSCCDHGTPAMPSPAVESDEFDEETRFELILAAYPPSEKERYQRLSPEMKRGVLAAHEARDLEALAIFNALPEGERNDLFAYEYGALLGRLGRYDEAVIWLQQAVAMMSGHLLAVTTLVDLHLAQKNFAAAEELLLSLLSTPQTAPYGHAQLAFLHRARGDEAQARRHAGAALQRGYREKGLMVFAAAQLEAEGHLDEAEQVLLSLPAAGGCGGGGHAELAEFWLRHGRQLPKALEIFKKGAQADPGNPLWVLRIAQTYLALGWKREARPMLETLVGSDLVEEALRNEASALLAASR